MKYKVSLCVDCLEEEFNKMDHGEPSGYLYAGEQYLKLYKEEKDKDGNKTEIK